jgi:predicted secreted acid phosphatase
MKAEPFVKAVLFDIDGVIADSSERLKLATSYDPPDWNAYDIGPYDDTPIGGWIALVNLLYPHYEVILVTARHLRGQNRAHTVEWLERHGVMYDQLIMCPEHAGQDLRTFKKDTAERIMNTYKVVLAVDDRLAHCEDYEALGIATIHVRVEADFSIPGATA